MRSTTGGGRPRALPRFLLLAGSTALLGLACLGCAPDPADREPPARSPATSDSPPPRQQPTDTDPRPKDPMPSDTSDSLRLAIDAPDTVPRGDAVPITFRVENVTDRTLSLHLMGRDIAFDVIVARVDGSTVWRRLEDEVLQAILRFETLAPGQALVLDALWDQRSNAGQPVPPGEYRVWAQLLTDGDPITSPLRTLRIATR